MDLALETIRVLMRFKNVILEGPPGTGKTHVVNKISSQWQAQTGRSLRGNARGRYAITLHPNTTYEEFVEGLRFDEVANGFTRQDGFLRRIIKEAEACPNEDFLVLIDEVNRANVPKVLGDLLLTMESSKRKIWDGSEWVGGMSVTLPYSGELFSVPSNVYLLGTMNSSDRSIAPLDSALRRRFGFVRVEPLGGKDLSDELIESDGSDAARRMSRSIDQLTNLNEALRLCLGPDAQLGHSYLFGVVPTPGIVNLPPDPLAPLRAMSADTTGSIFWLEARKLDGGSHNQLPIPDALQSMFLLGAGEGDGLGRNERVSLDIQYEGRLYRENILRYNEGGSNSKLYYQGRTSDGSQFSTAGGRGELDQKIHVWHWRDDKVLELALLQNSEEVIAALRGVSVPPHGWHQTTRPSQHGPGRPFGVVNRDTLSFSPAQKQDASESQAAERDAEWMIWRYAILPQLVDTVTQLSAPELLAKSARVAWLESAGAMETLDRWEKFDLFLADLSLAIVETGYGLSRGLTVKELPVGAIPEALAGTVEGHVSILEDGSEDEIESGPGTDA